MSHAGMDASEGAGARRARRLAAVVRQSIADEIAKMSDPSLREAIITGVDVGVDLDLATVYFFVRGGAGEISATEAAFERCAGRLRKAVAHNLQAKRVPKLRFRVDEGMVRGMSVEDRLGEIAGRPGSRVPERVEGGD